ncbi:MAG TPA: hypothetical protein VFQ79_01070 [Bryobacteraceae bacterium]|nr:hypothetical protein [Bryobacterales bacterium]HEU0138265.1 hypothetical protein [Bryobacteraceae bacterium]
MIVRIRLKPGAKVTKKPGRKQKVASALASLLTPASLMACVLSLWRLAADLQWTETFAISEGLFSHWQVWMLIAVALQSGAVLLNRYARASQQTGERVQ